MVKLSKAQQAALEKIKESVIKARSCKTYEEYFMKYEAAYCNKAFNTPEKYKAEDPDMWNRRKTMWEE